MVMCPYDFCIHNTDNECTKENIVLKISDIETESLKCLGFERFERKEKAVATANSKTAPTKSTKL